MGKIRNWERGDFEIFPLVRHRENLSTLTVPRMGWGAAVPGQAGVCVDKGLRALSIKMKACLTSEEHALLVG